MTSDYDKNEKVAIALHDAVEENNLPQVEKLLSEGIDVHAKCGFSRITPLHAAAMRNVDESHYEMAKKLLDSGADPNMQDLDGRTPVWFIVRSGNLKIVQLFLSFNADLSVIDGIGCNLLYPAVLGWNKNVEVLQLLFDFGLDPNNVPRYINLARMILVDEMSLKLVSFQSPVVCGKIIRCLLKNGASIVPFDRVDLKPLSALIRAISLIDIDTESCVRLSDLVMEHTDFSVAPDDVDVFNSRDCKHPDVCLCKLILMHFAKLQSLGDFVHPASLNCISKLAPQRDYYKRCEAELLRAKNTKLKNCWVSFYHLLVESRKKIKNYAGNKELIKDFKNSDCVKKFPIYGTKIKENMRKGIKRRKLFDKSCVLLSVCLPIFGSCHLVVRDVLDCIMSKKDLSKFCEKYKFFDKNIRHCTLL